MDDPVTKAELLILIAGVISIPLILAFILWVFTWSRQ